MARSQKKHDRIAYIACTSLALGIIVFMWVWSVRSIVGDGVQGSRELFSDVSDVASQARRQTQPSQETIDAIKEGMKGIVTADAEEAPADDPDEAASDPTLDAVAQLMKPDVETYGEEPKN